jgi:hypothetical protein
MTMATRRIHQSNAKRQAAYRRRLRQVQDTMLAAKGLPALPAVSNVAGWARWNKAMRQITDLLEQTMSEMQTYYDDRSERWLESEAAEDFQQRIEELQEFIDQVPDWS